MKGQKDSENRKLQIRHSFREKERERIEISAKKKDCPLRKIEERGNGGRMPEDWRPGGKVSSKVP